MAVRVVVAEDSLLMREGILQVLARAEDIDVVGDCADLPTVQAMVRKLEPDVLITDVRMPPTQSEEGIELAVALRESHPRMGVVVLSHYVEPAYAKSLLGGGSAGRAYLLKDRVSQPGQLADAVRTVAAGGSVVDPSVVDLIVAASNRGSASPLAQLTPRELQVLELVAQGKSNGGVARALQLSDRAVEKHINTLFAKLTLEPQADVNRRVSAVLLLLSERSAGR